MPSPTRSGITRSRPERTISLPMVVDSPPGRINPSTPSRSLGRRTSTSPTPIRRRAARCSITSPWIASTPIFIAPTLAPPAALRRRQPSPRPLHAARLQQLALGELADVEPAHRLADPLGDAGDHVRIVEVRGRLHDRLGPPGRILGLEDARADEVPVAPELHHQRRIRRRG